MKHTELIVSFVLLSSASVSHAIEVANAAADYQSAPGITATTGPSEAPAGWEYLYSDAASGGTEVSLNANVFVGNLSNLGFGSGTVTSPDVPPTANAGNNYLAPSILGSISGDGTEFGLFGGFGHAGVVGTDLVVHPGDTSDTAYVIARYTFSAADLTNGDNATISGSFRDLQGSDNANAGPSIIGEVLVNDTVLFSAEGAQSRLYNDGQTPSGIFTVATTVSEGDTISFVVFNNGRLFSDETALQGSIDLGVTVTPLPPSITLNPESEVLAEGDPLSLTVTASGTDPLSYQWQLDGTDIAGASSDTYGVASVTLADAGDYTCVVTNSEGSATSAVATITVSNPPVASSPDISTEVNVTATLAVGALATDPNSQILSIISADATSVGGAEISFNSTQVVYLPVADTLITDDTFTCIVSNESGLTVEVTVTIDVVSGTTASNIVANPASDYVDSSAPPSQWSYLGANNPLGNDDGGVGVDIAFDLTPSTGIGNAGNTGFGQPGAQFLVPAILGGIEGGDAFEIFEDGQNAHEGLSGLDLLLHPGNGNNDNAYVIARYTFSAAEIVSNGNAASVSGSFRDLAGGTGGGGAGSVTAEIYLNDDLVYSVTGAGGRLFQADGTFDLTDLPVAADDTLSFVVGNNGNFGGDETALRAEVRLSAGIPALALDTPDGAGSNYVFTYSRSDATEGSEVHLFQHSSDLINWTDIFVDSQSPEVGIVGAGQGVEDVTISISKSSLGDDRIIFGRIQVVPD